MTGAPRRTHANAAIIVPVRINAGESSHVRGAVAALYVIPRARCGKLGTSGVGDVGTGHCGSVDPPSAFW
jgi:hypothetical protein